jgi:hypothetical protein
MATEEDTHLYVLEFTNAYYIEREGYINIFIWYDMFQEYFIVEAGIKKINSKLELYLFKTKKIENIIKWLSSVKFLEFVSLKYKIYDYCNLSYKDVTFDTLNHYGRIPVERIHGIQIGSEHFIMNEDVKHDLFLILQKYSTNN